MVNWTLIAGVVAVVVAGGQFLIYTRTSSNYIQVISIITAVISFLAGLGLILFSLAQ